ncbi:MAG: hypothetical protein WD794_04795 [Mycobacteriales bacterium]
MTGDDVQLTDLEVIQRFSLAVRGATASRAAVVAALQADLDWLTGARRAAPTEPAVKSPKRTPTAASRTGSARAKAAPSRRPTG